MTFCRNSAFRRQLLIAVVLMLAAGFPLSVYGQTATPVDQGQPVAIAIDVHETIIVNDVANPELSPEPLVQPEPIEILVADAILVNDAANPELGQEPGVPPAPIAIDVTDSATVIDSARGPVGDGDRTKTPGNNPASPGFGDRAIIGMVVRATSDGVWFLPAADDEVIVSCARGDSERPVDSGSLWNGPVRVPDAAVVKDSDGNAIGIDDLTCSRVAALLGEPAADGIRQATVVRQLRTTPTRSHQRGIPVAQQRVVAEENGAGKFRIDIVDVDASANVESVTVEDLAINERPMTGTGVVMVVRRAPDGERHVTALVKTSDVANRVAQFAAAAADAGDDTAAASLAQLASMTHAAVDVWVTDTVANAPPSLKDRLVEAVDAARARQKVETAQTRPSAPLVIAKPTPTPTPISPIPDDRIARQQHRILNAAGKDPATEQLTDEDKKKAVAAGCIAGESGGVDGATKDDQADPSTERQAQQRCIIDATGKDPATEQLTDEDKKRAVAAGCIASDTGGGDGGGSKEPTK